VFPGNLIAHSSQKIVGNNENWWLGKANEIFGS
jgi:hypothetical protein